MPQKNLQNKKQKTSGGRLLGAESGTAGGFYNGKKFMINKPEGYLIT